MKIKLVSHSPHNRLVDHDETYYIETKYITKLNGPIRRDIGLWQIGTIYQFYYVIGLINQNEDLKIIVDEFFIKEKDEPLPPGKLNDMIAEQNKICLIEFEKIVKKFLSGKK